MSSEWPVNSIPRSLEEINPIENGGQIPVSREQLFELVETPLAEACALLYDKNIKTISSSANKQDLASGEAYIVIDFDTLSRENQQIALEFAEPHTYHGSNPGRGVKLSFAIDQTTDLQELSRQAREAADRFKKQPMMWAPSHTREELGIAPGDDLKPWEDAGYFFDPKTDRFYQSKEHIAKVNEHIEAT